MRKGQLVGKIQLGAEQYEGEEFEGLNEFMETEGAEDYYEDYDYEFEDVSGAVPRYTPAQQRMLAQKQAAQRRQMALRKQPRYMQPRQVPVYRLPSESERKLGIAKKMAGQQLRPTMTGDVVDPEPFAITSAAGSPGAVALVANVANVRSLIGTYTIPVGYRFVFDPDDPYQEYILTPFTSAGIADANFILGDTEVMLESATGGKQWRILHTNTLYMRPASNVSSVGHLRKWQHKYVAVPGDLVRFYFTSPAVLLPANSFLSARLRAGRKVA